MMLEGSVYRRLLLFTAGMGGLLYGIDVGIIAAALLYLGKTVSLSVGQTSAIVAAVLGGSMISSVIAGFLADFFGRRPMVIVSGLLFVASVGLIVTSQTFVPLLLGRLLQGLSGGVIAVVVPLYLAECLSPGFRGRGSAIFQLMLTVGIVIAALVGFYFTRQAEAQILAAAGDALRTRAAADHAWRGMFLSVVCPGLIFCAGTLFLGETPRWLFRRGRLEEAYRELRRSNSQAEADLQFAEMKAAGVSAAPGDGGAFATGSLLRRRYVAPFLLACVILACNQATGINSILAYLVVILKQAGMSAQHATQGDLAVKLLNCLITVVAASLVDRKGRKFLLVMGTAGVVLALAGAGLAFRSFESGRSDVKSAAQKQISGSGAESALPVDRLRSSGDLTGPSSLTVLYRDCEGALQSATALSTDPDPVLRLPGMPCRVRIEHAFLQPLPSERTGWVVAGCLGLFIAAFAIGPGVVVWLALSELMPTRIRSAGMGIALLINQGVSTAIAGTFLPVVGRFGFSAMFGFWALCTVIYFLAAAFYLPETKGKTLEEIEQHFDPATVGA